MVEGPRRLIARLAVAVMAADRDVTPTELAALEGLALRELPALARLERLGLGALAGYAFEEVRRLEREPVDVVAVCRALRGAAPEAGPAVLAALVEVAAVDGPLGGAEIEVLHTVAARLGVGLTQARRVLARTAGARQVLRIDRRYRRLVAEPRPASRMAGEGRRARV
jgi:uncharacterized tellurite resistance protein B-like protein